MKQRLRRWWHGVKVRDAERRVRAFLALYNLSHDVTVLIRLMEWEERLDRLRKEQL